MTVQYLIDSENVGDFWIPLLELPAEETELIVFYTRNSPHMSYDSLIRLKESNRSVTFIKCFEGTNALDFQLVSELGYRICENGEGRFVIVTNDTGFDAAVKYWRRRKKSVKRITGKEAKNLERRIREDLAAAHGEKAAAAERVPVRRYTAVEHDTEHDAHVDAYHAAAAQDPDGRPSRANLRDAERAAQPEFDEAEMAEDRPYDAEGDLEMDAYEPEDEALNDGDFEEADAESEEDGYADDLPYKEDEEYADLEEAVDADDLPDLGLNTESSFETVFPEPVTEDPEERTASQAQIAQAYADMWAEDAEADIPAEQADDADQTLLIESQQLDFLAQVAPDRDGRQEQEPEADNVVSDLSDGAAVSEEPASEIAAEETDAMISAPVQDLQPAENAADSGSDQPAEDTVSEEAAAENSHRSRSRRSRSRRSRSSAKKQEQEKPAEAAEEKGAAEADASETPSEQVNEEQTQTDAPASFDASMPPGDEEIARIVACIGADNLAELHNQLATFYGDQGKEIYLSIKNNTRSLPVLKPDLRQKFAYYCEIIFVRSDYTGEYPADISEYLLSVREKLNNLNSLRYALQKHYGKEKGRRFYFLLKPFAKTMYQM